MPVASSLLDDRYLLTERIGVGGFSEVWLAHDRVLDRPVAVKLLHSSFAGHEETLHRFRAEARHAGALSHQNIARVYDYGDPRSEHPPYLVMELVEGESLAEVLRSGGAMDAARAMDVIAQTAAGLEAAHQAGLVHRDIKPANLLLSGAGVVKITDFGISYAAGSAPVTRTGMIVGTPSYLAPERASGAKATESSDIYALGVVAYECLTGAPPFAGTAIEVAVAHRDRPLPPLPASVPAAVAWFVEGLTAKDPAVRPASAADVAATAARLRDQLRAGHQEPAASLAPQPAAASRYEAPVPTQFMIQPPVRRRPGWRAAFGLAGGAVIVALAVLAGANLLGAASHHGSNSPPKASPVTATRVEVNDKALIGLPVSEAVRELRQLHLRVKVQRQTTEDQPPGRVAAVFPTGRVAVGSVVTVIAAEQGQHHDHGKGHDHGHGNGDGGSGGGDNGGGDGGGGQGN